MRDLYIKNGQGFILVYSLVNQQSFQDIRPMRDQIIRVKRYEKVPVILVGNKVDLESEREVSSSEGRALAEEWGCPFMETSAKSKTMVDELFAEIVRQMNYASQPDKDDPCCSAVDKFIGKLIYSSVVSFTFILFCDPIMQKGKMLHQYLNGKREALGEKNQQLVKRTPKH
ncbi:hypothetical protein E2320_004830 [Naja naja]|nr:hypothetical protein E2320_004830 [Naja naja]